MRLFSLKVPGSLRHDMEPWKGEFIRGFIKSQEADKHKCVFEGILSFCGSKNQNTFHWLRVS